MVTVRYITRRREPILGPAEISFVFMAVKASKVGRWTLNFSRFTRSFHARRTYFDGDPVQVQRYIQGMPPEAAAMAVGKSIAEIFRAQLTAEDIAACTRFALTRS